MYVGDDANAVAGGCRHLLARILYQGLVDEALVRGGVPIPKGEWPWNGWNPQIELDAFWQGVWLERLCDWLDLSVDDVVDLGRELRDGEAIVEAYTKRIVRTGGPGDRARANGSGAVDHARDAAFRQLTLWEA